MKNKTKQLILSGYDIDRRYFREVEQKKRGIVYLGVPVSARCNLNCIYCFSNGGKALSNELTLEERLNIIKQGKKLGAKTIIIAEVGEPLLDPAIKEIVGCAYQNGLKTILYTNGTLIDKEMANYFYKRKVSLIVKIDSFNPEIHDKLVNRQGALEKAKNGLQILIDKGFSKIKKGDITRLAIETIITKYNLKDISKIAEFCKNNNIKFILQTPVWIGRAANKIRKLAVSEKQIDWLKNKFQGQLLPFASPEIECIMLKYALIVGITGDVKICFADYLNVLGNTRKKTLKDILKVKKRKFKCIPKGCPIRDQYRNKTYFFGYGSFCNKKHMKKYLGVDYNSIPVRIKGYKRMFIRIMNDEDKKTRGIPLEQKTTTMLTLTKDSKNSVNGVLFTINKKQLKILKERDLFYNFKKVDVYDLDSNFMTEALTFVSESKDNLGNKILIRDNSFIAPNEHYLNISREGAYSFGELFGQEWDRTTYLSDQRNITEYLKSTKKF
ncbi:radical SAM protein [Patescibacteria group bacterium]|nr:radical SAM protein [Patescibacteria group bacterium]